MFKESSCWIWTKEPEVDDGTPKVVYFRKTLLLDAAPHSAIIRVSADSRYRLYVNGQSVAFGPCKGDDKVWYYDEIDIAPYLSEGENVLAAVVLRYSTLHKGNHSIWRTPTPGFYLDGAILRADETWKYKRAEHIKLMPEHPFMQFLYHIEDATGDSAYQGWQGAGFDDEGWQHAREYHPFMMSKGSSPGNLLPRPIPFLYEADKRLAGVTCLRQSEAHEQIWEDFISGGLSVTIRPNSIEIIELDAGELTTGFIQLAVTGGAGAELRILTSEAYGYAQETQGPMSMPRKADRTDCVNGELFGFADCYHVAGYGCDSSPEVYEPFWFRTFRFIQLQIITKDEPLQLADLHYRETGYPLEAKTSVQTSDENMAGIWDISLRTLRRCMHETYEDCPFYEQLQYAMDTRSQILYTYSVSADDRLARRCIDDFHRSLRYDGLTNCCYPSVGTNVIPGFSLYYIMMIHDHMMYFGDKELVARYMPTINAILNFFERSLDNRGLVGKIGDVLGSRFWSFIDWTPEWRETMGVPDSILNGPITMESLLYAKALALTAELSEFIGCDGDLYTKRAEAVKTAINKHCIGSTGLYQDGPGLEKYSQHCQVWAVLSETAPESKWQALMKAALQDDTLTKCSVAMAFYLFRAVEEAGLYAQTGALWEPWREMLRCNLTTCVEDHVNTRSDCHAWGALALYEIPSVVLGVRPAKPGYAAISIKPNTEAFDWAKGDVITPKGVVHVEWERVGQEIKVKFDTPPVVEVIRKNG